MWSNEYFLNSWHHNCETSENVLKKFKKIIKCKEKFKCSCNLGVTKVDNNLVITSVHSSLDLGNKIWIGKPFIPHSCLLQKPPSWFFIFATCKLWNYLVQAFLAGFSSFVLSDYTSLGFSWSSQVAKTRLINIIKEMQM